MKIFDGNLINEIPVGETIVLQKHISGRKSMFYGKTLIYLGDKNPSVALFKMVHRVSARPNEHGTDVVPTMYHIPSIPLSLQPGDIKNSLGETAMRYGPTIKIFGNEISASESYTNVTKQSEHKDFIELNIEISKSDFAFVGNIEFTRFIKRQKITNLIDREVVTEIIMPVAKKVRSEEFSIYTLKAVVELEQRFDEIVTIHNQEIGTISYFQPTIIYKLHNCYYTDPDPGTVGQAHPLVFVKKDNPNQIFNSASLRFDVNNNPLYDECLVDVGQIINFTYYPTVRSLNNDDFIIPRKYYVLNKELTSSEEVEYIGASQSWTIVSKTTSEEQTDISVPPSFENLYRQLYDGSAVNNFTNTGTNWVDQLIRNNENVPTSYDLSQGDTVYIKEEFIGNRTHRKNREYTVLSYIGTNENNEQIYKIQPTHKKTFNGEGSLDIKSKSLFKAEKILKRKFILEKDFGKYKAGQCFTKDEMIQIFGKFQDARDPFILNKLYICAE